MPLSNLVAAKPSPGECPELAEFSERPSPKPPPVDESEPPSDESAESVELPSACLRPAMEETHASLSHDTNEFS